MRNAYQVSMQVREDLTIGVFVAGDANIDEMLDAMRGFMVACGFAMGTAQKLQIVEPDGDQE